MIFIEIKKRPKRQSYMKKTRKCMKMKTLKRKQRH